MADATRAFQQALDLNPSSAKAHEGLGIALVRQLTAQDIRPAAYNEVVERAAAHLREASQLSPQPPFHFSSGQIWKHSLPSTRRIRRKEMRTTKKLRIV